MNEVHVAMQIGCLECGEPSKVLGVFDSIGKAEKVVRYAQGWHQFPENWKGERRYHVYTAQLNYAYPYKDELQAAEAEVDAAVEPSSSLEGQPFVATVVNINREWYFVEFEHEGQHNLMAYTNAEEMKLLSVGDKVYVERVDYDDPWWIVDILSPQEVERLKLPRLVNAPAGW